MDTNTSLVSWIMSKIATTFSDYHNSSVRSWIKGYRKALMDVLDFLNNKETKNPFIDDEKE